MLKENYPSLIARPLTEHEWQVVAGGGKNSGGIRIVGFIEELGGTYEVGVYERPELCQYFETFKEAMDFFDDVEHGAPEHGPLEHDAIQTSAAC